MEKAKEYLSRDEVDWGLLTGYGRIIYTTPQVMDKSLEITYIEGILAATGYREETKEAEQRLKELLDE